LKNKILDVNIEYKNTCSNKCYAISNLAHFASFLFTFSYGSQLRKHKQKLPVAYLMSWQNNIFNYKLRTIELKILRKSRTASLNFIKLAGCIFQPHC